MFRHLRLYNTKVPEAKALLIDVRNLPSKYFRVIAAKQKQYASVLTDVLSDLLERSSSSNVCGRVAVIGIVSDHPLRSGPWSPVSPFGDSDFSNNLICFTCPI